MAKQFYQ